MDQYSWVPVIVELFLSQPVFQAFCWIALGVTALVGVLFGAAALLNAIAKLRGAGGDQ